jgi:predicted kinase
MQLMPLRAAGMEARHKALLAAMDDMLNYLSSEKGQVAIFDATNTTEERRQFLVGPAGLTRAAALAGQLDSVSPAPLA